MHILKDINLICAKSVLVSKLGLSRIFERYAEQYENYEIFLESYNDDNLELLKVSPPKIIRVVYSEFSSLIHLYIDLEIGESRSICLFLIKKHAVNV